MPPLSVMIKPVSGACNMQCRYCFYADEMQKREKPLYPKMSSEALETVVRKVMACAEERVSFAFQGGEPTLIGLPFFEALVRFQRQYNARGLQVSNAVQTNGLELPDEMLHFFARERFLLGVSVDGTEMVHDTFRRDRQGAPTHARVMDTIRRMQAFGVDFNVLCVVGGTAASHAKEVFEALAPYSYVQFIPCLEPLDGGPGPDPLTPEGYLSFLKNAFDLYERAFWQGKPVSIRSFDNYVGILLGMPPENCAMAGVCSPQLLIESDGSTYPCDFYALDEWKTGNILTDPLRRILRSARAEAFREESLPLPQKCCACRWYPLCRNGCRRERGADGVNRWCACMGEFFAYSIERMQKMAQEIARREKEKK